MPLTYGQLLARLRPLIWPMDEAPNLVPAHNQSFLECLIDLQTWVPCLRRNNTNIYPQCATFYNCGMTSFEGPRGIIKSLEVLDSVAEVSSGDVIASKVGNLVTASGAIFSRDMVGETILFPDGQQFTILTFIDETRIWVYDPAIITEAAPGTTAAYFYLSARWRINPDGRQEMLGEEDNEWHVVEVVGPAGNVQIGIEQDGTP